MRLPDKPSELLQLALNDLKMMSKKEGYKIDMETWHYYDKDSDTCYICLAGAVMAHTLSIDRYEYSPHSDLDEDTLSKIRAINCFREGLITRGLDELGIYNIFEASMSISSYNDNTEDFMKDMGALVTLLQQWGI